MNKITERMKTNRTTQKRKAATKNAKKTKALSLIEFEGKPYNGFPISKSWTLGKSDWKESRRGIKTWDISFEADATTNTENDLSLPIGSEFHSYILAHQKIVKTHKNAYKLKIQGIKFKLAHKLRDENWSATSQHQKKNLIQILKDVLKDLEMNSGRAPVEPKKKPFPTKNEGFL